MNTNMQPDGIDTDPKHDDAPTHWYADLEWHEAEGPYGYPDVRPVYVVRGPVPFDRLVARNSEHAEQVASELNRKYEREVPDPETSAEPDDDTTVGLANALAKACPGVDVSVSGRTITFAAPCVTEVERA